VHLIEVPLSYTKYNEYLVKLLPKEIDALRTEFGTAALLSPDVVNKTVGEPTA
jgi:hypothetical protein